MYRRIQWDLLLGQRYKCLLRDGNSETYCDAAVSRADSVAYGSPGLVCDDPMSRSSRKTIVVALVVNDNSPYRVFRMLSIRRVIRMLAILNSSRDICQ